MLWTKQNNMGLKKRKSKQAPTNNTSQLFDRNIWLINERIMWIQWTSLHHILILADFDFQFFFPFFSCAKSWLRNLRPANLKRKTKFELKSLSISWEHFRRIFEFWLQRTYLTCLLWSSILKYHQVCCKNNGKYQHKLRKQ